MAILPVFLTVFAAAVPVAHADSRVFPTGYWGPLLSCTGNYSQVVPVGQDGVSQTCVNFCDLLYTGQNVLDFGITASLFVGAPIMFVYGGVLLLVSGVDSESRSKAKKVVLATAIGVAITLGSYLMISTFLWFFGNGPNSAIQVSWPDIRCDLGGNSPPGLPGPDGTPPPGGGSDPNGTCTCSGTISRSALLSEAAFDQYCLSPQVQSNCSSCGSGTADCSTTFSSTRSECESYDDDPWNLASQAGLPGGARPLVNVSATCSFAE